MISILFLAATGNECTSNVIDELYISLCTIGSEDSTIEKLLNRTDTLSNYVSEPSEPQIWEKNNKNLYASSRLLLAERPFLLAKLTYKTPLSVSPSVRPSVSHLFKKILSGQLLLNGWMDWAEIFREFSFRCLVVHLTKIFTVSP